MFVYEINNTHREDLLREAAEYRRSLQGADRATRRGFSLRKTSEGTVRGNRSRFTPAA
ncbi:hypothetical protein [Streptomyces sp. G-G2]|uniref:hypothetical protein n=1 Tax=Streptomyces sp. G-G2 TaxID=3046201 RepID=UPI0024BB70B2|nr:hypothetical protein [Streptomyces sp. G-G2]MDJ0379510.1 hypothetical protein [Streptomyces sp. G-G2]